MKKTLFISLLISTCVLVNSCSLFKTRATQTTIARQEQKNDVTVKKEVKDSVESYKAGISENTTKVASEEITIKNNASEIPIELTATFRVDTSASLKGDTALKLIDINDKDVSVAIFQNKKTNELTAKVTSKGRSKNIPFSEMQIKRQYTETSNKVDTTKKEVAVKNTKLDSLNKSKQSSFNKEKEKESKLSATGMIVLIVLGLVVIGVLVFFGIRLYNKIKLGK